MILSISEAARRLHASVDEVIDAAGLTLSDIEHATQQCGLIPERCYDAPILPEGIVDQLGDQLMRLV